MAQLARTPERSGRTQNVGLPKEQSVDRQKASESDIQLQPLPGQQRRPQQRERQQLYAWSSASVVALTGAVSSYQAPISIQNESSGSSPAPGLDQGPVNGMPTPLGLSRPMSDRT